MAATATSPATGHGEQSQHRGPVASICAGGDEATILAATALDQAWLLQHNEPSPLIAAAASLAYEWHNNQRRLSGEAYISHPLAVAALVAELGFDEESVAAACCHDLLEDTALTSDKLAEATNTTVASLVEALTKVDRARDMTHRRATAASVLKLVISVSGDVRALVIKLADRLHNVRTIAALPPERQRRIAHETLEVFSPLAHRLGMEKVRFELEDRCFALLYPAEHEALVASLRGLDLEQQAADLATELRAELERHGVNAEVSARSKHLWSVYSKLRRTGVDAGGLHDMIGVRVIVDTPLDCYRALGVVHALYPPIPGRFKDYIAQPKPNGYQSLHTTVVGRRREAEIQIRTRPMHVAAAHGIAAHYRYKTGAGTAHTNPDLEAVEQLALADPEELYALLREELAPEGQVIVLTPKGDTVTLPAGSTAIDFAYKIHTDIGNTCVGARVNGVLQPVSAPLRTGDIVEIAGSRDSQPDPAWLDVARTARAREQIRRALTSNSTADEPREPDETSSTCDSPVEHDGPETAGMFEKAKTVSIARCCWPTAPDEVGAQHTGDAVVIHRVDCVNYRAEPSRGAAPWTAHGNVAFNVHSCDRAGLLRDLTETFTELSVNLGSVESVVGGGLEVSSTFIVDVVDDVHIEAVRARLASVPGVFSVRTQRN
jgi:(p)ppGpp synthase/HD superfamily hydrolase